MEKRISFHQQLRQERELRGWSQADLATKVHSDTKTVGRWERGKSLPHPFHRQKLCELFGKNAEELGLTELDGSELPQRTMPQEDWDDVPDVTNFAGRVEETAMLEQWMERDHFRVVVVLGMGGVGKTALAAKVARQMKDTFEYVFWRSLQNAPPLKPLLKSCIQFVSDQQHTDLPEEVD